MDESEEELEENLQNLISEKEKLFRFYIRKSMRKFSINFKKILYIGNAPEN